MLEIPFVGPKDLDGIPFLSLSLEIRGTSPLPKTTPESYNEAYQKFEDALRAFVAEPQLLNPDNYLDSVMSQYVNISQHQFAILYDDIKAYYMNQPEGVLKTQLFEKIMGGLVVPPTPTSEPMDPDFIGTYIYAILVITKRKYLIFTKVMIKYCFS